MYSTEMTGTVGESNKSTSEGMEHSKYTHIYKEESPKETTGFLDCSENALTYRSKRIIL